MKNLLVTGGCGFIGANLIQYLLKNSNYTGRIINIDALTYAGNPESLVTIEKEYSDRYFFHKVDICDRAATAEVFQHYDIDSICHLAAESHVDRSIVKPDTFIQTNVMGTFNLLEIARERLASTQLFHHVSTDEVFGSLGEKGFFTETTAYKPNSPYSASKAASDHLVRAYHKTYGLPVTISNCSNNYGPYQFPEKLIPLMILNARESKSLPVYGDGSNVRDWLYVMDHCRAIWTIMTEGKHGGTYNVGGENEMSNLTVVETICDLLDELLPQPGKSRRNLISFVKDRPGHDWRYAIDFTKLKEELGWKPVETFRSGIRKTIEWYLENSEWVDRVRSGEYQQWISTHYQE